MGGKQSSDLRHRRIGTVDDEGHEEQGEGEVFRVEVEDEEADLTRRAILCEGIRVRHCECGEEGVAVEEAACEGLLFC